MSDRTPLLITLGPAETPPLHLPGFDARLVSPFAEQPSTCRVSLSEVHSAWTTLASVLLGLPSDLPVVLYGCGAYGTLAVYAMSQTKQLRAALIRSALIDPLSALALTDVISPDPKTSLHSQIHALAADCVLENIREISAPLLILHGEADLQVPSAQADELFVLMKALHPDLPSRLVLFPEEGHTFSLSAESAALEEMTRFLTAHLGGDASR